MTLFCLDKGDHFRCYNFSNSALAQQVKSLITFYNEELERYKENFDSIDSIEVFINRDSEMISWSGNLKKDLERFIKHKFNSGSVTKSSYRPYTKMWGYFDRSLNERVYQMPHIFPHNNAQNNLIVLTGLGETKDFSALMVNLLPDFKNHYNSQCFPLYLYEDNENKKGGDLFNGLKANEGNEGYTRMDGLSDEGLKHFQKAYPSEKISKEDIFYYIYGLLHSEDYKTRYADNLKKELPRIPCVKSAADFWAFSKAGRALADLHINYESVEPYQLDFSQDINKLSQPEDFKVTKMRFGKTGKDVDKTVVIYNSKITMRGIPLEAYDYIVNGKPALEWIMERYAITTHKESGIVNDANQWGLETANNPRYPLELFQRVVTVSLETMKIVKSLPALSMAEQAATTSDIQPPADPDWLSQIFPHPGGREEAISKILPYIVQARPGIRFDQAFQRARMATFPEACSTLLAEKGSEYQEAFNLSELAKFNFSANGPVRKHDLLKSWTGIMGIVINNNGECELQTAIQLPLQGVEVLIPLIMEAGDNYDLGLEKLLAQERFQSTDIQKWFVQLGEAFNTLAA